MKYLLVVAHPDDEVLGAGASMWKWSHEGDEVDVAIMCTEAKARAFRPSDAELEGDTDAATNYVGVSKKYEATFPNIEMNTIKVRDIEIGAGAPKIIVPIVGVTKNDIIEEAKTFDSIPVDVVEWRVDWFENVFEFDKVEEMNWTVCMVGQI